MIASTILPAEQNATGTFTLSVTDDAPGGQVFSVTNLSVANGTLTLASTTGLTFVTGDGTADASMTFTGTLANINAALTNATFTPPNGFTGDTTLNLTISDLQITAPNGAQITNNNFTITTFGGGNEAPAIMVPGAQTVNEDTNLTIGGISITDGNIGTGIASVTLSVTGGALTLSQTTGLTFSAGDGASDSTMTFTGALAHVNSAINNLVYRANGNASGSDTLSISVSDQGYTGGPPRSTATLSPSPSMR